MEIHVETEIAARPEEVWATLTDLPHFHDWNPFIRRARGTIAVGERVRVEPLTSLGVRLAFEPVVTICDAPHELRWRGVFGSARLGRGEHTFAIEPAGPGRVRLVQHMTFGGLLSRLFGWLIARESKRGFTAMNEAVAHRLEEARP